MNILKNTYHEVKENLIDGVKYIKRFIWNRGVKLLWFKLWIRKDEFHSSLKTDLKAMLGMNEKQREKYLSNLTKRRNIAHYRDLE